MQITENRSWSALEKLAHRHRKLNIGCGNNHWKGFVNVDIDPEMKPDLVLDIAHEKLPFQDNAFEEIWMMHTLEHIKKSDWPNVFFEVNRGLGIGGRFYLAYPEFKTCAQYWKENKWGKREYWEACIYGRQSSPYDVHVSICDTDTLKHDLYLYGFGDFISTSENEPQYSILQCVKKQDTRTKEDLLNDRVFAGGV